MNDRRSAWAQAAAELVGIYLPNRYLSSKARLFLDAVEQGLSPITAGA